MNSEPTDELKSQLHSELHGLCCGLICSAQPEAEALFREELTARLNELELSTDSLLMEPSELFSTTANSLDDLDWAFQPTLPEQDESTTLSRQAEALVDWCRAFLYGLGRGGIGDDDLSGQVREVVRDMVELTKLDTAGIDDDDDQDADLTELLEFVKVAVLLVRDELRPKLTEAALHFDPEQE